MVGIVFDVLVMMAMLISCTAAMTVCVFVGF